jgi:hypothetical protein
MKQLQLVDPLYIYSIWDEVKHYFKDSVEASPDDINVEQYKLHIISGTYSLFVVVEDDKIIGAFIMYINNLPNYRVLHISAFGGKGVANKEVAAQVETYAKSQGVTKIKACAKDAQARLFKRAMGLEKVTNVIEKLI